MLRKCCAHCPGSVTRTGDPIREHVCNLPDYVAGNLRVSTLRPHRNNNVNNNYNGNCKNNKKIRSRSAGNNNNNRRCHEAGDDVVVTATDASKSCYERFAVAKKFHAENLQHQPLPDRVDDAIFTQHIKTCSEKPCMCDVIKRCQKIVPRRSQLQRKKELSRVHKYIPALGCKKPMTYMDLAICWETPIDPSYEPRRAVHIDGSDGGPGPAIFTLVSHEDSQVDVRDGCIPGQQDNAEENDDDDEEEEDDECYEDKFVQVGEQNNESNEALCKHLNSLHISTKSKEAKTTNGAIGDEARGKRGQFMRHCMIACDKNDGNNTSRVKNPRGIIRSASCLQKHGCSVITKKNNGLPNQGGSRVPRPRTPYARRSFCIDTLSPPFSIVHGCRDADYPEHWRLTSIYQQSYRHPRKMREGRTILNYDNRHGY